VDGQDDTVYFGLLQETRLTPTSYIVLGLIELVGGEATPYQLKQLVPHTVGHFWSLNHAQLYAEPERLAKAGYLDEQRERSGRRRKRYSLTEEGREALLRWRAEPTDQLAELRAPGVLKLFFGADPAKLAPVQLEACRQELTELEAIKQGDSGGEPRGPWLALEMGMRINREAVRFWEDVIAGRAVAGKRRRPGG
jgi:PadR family transcriptional regulator AphA